MLGVGTTALISQAAGRKDQPQAELVFINRARCRSGIALALGAVGFVSINAYANSLSADPATAGLAKQYLVWFLPAMLLQFRSSRWARLTRDGIFQAPVIFQVVSVILNIVLAPFLISGSDRAETWCHGCGTRDLHFHYSSPICLSFGTVEKKYRYLRSDFALWRAQ